MNTKAAAQKNTNYNIKFSLQCNYVQQKLLDAGNVLLFSLPVIFFFFFIHITILPDDPNMIETRLAGERQLKLS